MSLLVLDQRPVVRAVGEQPVLDDLIFRRVIRIFADAACKLGVIGINTRVNDGNRHTRAARICPDILQIDVIQIGLQLVRGIRHRILRTHGQTLAAALLRIHLTKVADARLEVNAHTRQIGQILLRLHHVQKADTLRQRQRCKRSIRGNTKLRSQLFGQALCRTPIRIRQYDTPLVVFTLSITQLLYKLALDLLQFDRFALLQPIYDCADAQHKSDCQQYE